MDPLFFAFEGEREFIEELVQAADQAGLGHSAPVPVGSPADALDSPIGAEDIKVILEVVSVAFTTGTAALAFVTKAIELLRQRRQAAVVKDPRTGKTIGRIDGDSNPTDTIKLLER